LDTEGALHHVMVRGIERRKIFRTDEDREDLLRRIGTIIPGTGAGIYAWALMPNHFHLLVRTGRLPLCRFS
jgi:putative transposase